MVNLRRKVLVDREIEDVLGDSDIGDFIPSDEDNEDPQYMPPRCLADSSSDTSTDTASASENDEVPIGMLNSSSVSGTNRRGRGGRGRRRGGRHAARRGGRSGRGNRNGENQTGSIRTPSPSQPSPVQTPTWRDAPFAPNLPEQISAPSYLPNQNDHQCILDYFNEYLDDGILTLCVEKTNQTAVKNTGKSMDLSCIELKRYIGMTLIMASVGYPVMRMYWQKKWRIPAVADVMSRNRFQQLRNCIKFVFDDDVSMESKSKDKLWKMRPLIDQIQKGCRSQEKPQIISLDEMIIPFTGACSIRQFCPGKPNPTGLKVFVLASPDGIVCDFTIYQGSTTYPDYDDSSFGLAAKSVLALADSLVPGHVLYFDRYFTSEKLADELLRRGIGCTGTIMKNRIPKGCTLKTERELKSEGRGSSNAVVRADDKMAITQWLDNKPVIFMSTVECVESPDTCQRWCKSTKSYVTVPRPRVVREYNRNMGGVDLTDRLLAVCPNRYKTKKWTQRFFAHMTDLAVCNSWLQFKKDELMKNVPAKKVPMLREFKLQLGESLIGTTLVPERNDCVELEESVPCQNSENCTVRGRGKPTTVLPSKEQRVAEAKHMPAYEEKQSRCRLCHYNKSHIRCQTCAIFLCLNKNRNCYDDFHKV